MGDSALDSRTAPALQNLGETGTDSATQRTSSWKTRTISGSTRAGEEALGASDKGNRSRLNREMWRMTL